MKVWATKFLYLAIQTVTGTMDLISKLLYWLLFAASVGAGLTFGCLLAFSYFIYGS
ncbi:hypothetical protein I5398_04960 [Citrobacter freundii]|uniref:hypothetical protein n=1 Tax=Citrobacter freundii complex TaxID=1344959 RepID=UPI001865E5D3|nr:hypothetical protein [Citrobacter youngae]EHZ8371928.1 hypothetical protein [Salmonella enterica]MBJ8795381.1 hypothetical protein [Citrobacter freundii]HCT6244622.1 hypothetical protein [Citrobacter freundii]